MSSRDARMSMEGFDNGMSMSGLDEEQRRLKKRNYEHKEL